MELLGVRRKGKPPDRDVRASDFAPAAGWKSPTDARFPDWLDACDRGAAHPTTGSKPEFDEAEMAAAIMGEVCSMLDGAKVDPALREWAEQAKTAVLPTEPS